MNGFLRSLCRNHYDARGVRRNTALALACAGVLLSALAVRLPAAEPGENGMVVADGRCGPVLQPRRATIPNSVVVAPFKNLSPDHEKEWIGDALRIALTTELNKVRYLEVFAPELFARHVAKDGDAVAAAKRLRIGRVVSGTFVIVDRTIRIDAGIVNAESGMHDRQGSDAVEGRVDDLFTLQKDLVFRMLKRLQVEISAVEKESIEERTNANVDAYRLFLQAEGALQPAAAPSSATPAPTPASRRESGGVWQLSPAAAYAQSDDEVSLRAFFEAYGRAHEMRDLDRLASLFVDFPPDQRAAMRAYLDSVEDLKVEFGDVRIVERSGPEVAVSYTRRDRFVDRKTNKPLVLEARLTKIMRYDDGQWKISRGVPQAP